MDDPPFDFDDDDFDPDSLEDDEPSEEEGAGPREPPPPPMQFYCAGADRKDAKGQPCCKFKAVDRWFGRCPSCGFIYACKPIKRAAESRMRLNLGDTSAVKPMRYWSTGIPELDRVLGGGIVLGKTILLGGKRGAGKTTVLLQAAAGFATKKRPAYFCSGEDDRDAVVNYAQRLGIQNEHIEVFGDPRGLNVEEVVSDARSYGSRLVIVDSLQCCEYSESKADVGQVAQVEACINHLTSFAKQKKVAMIIIGHLNQDGNFAGGEKIQHLVDVLLRFDPKVLHDADGDVIEDCDNVREFWVDGKSRQGRTDITSLMEMTEKGLTPLSNDILRRVTRLHSV